MNAAGHKWEPEAEPPDIIRPGHMEDEFQPAAELDIPIEGSLEESAEAPDLRDEDRDDDDSPSPAPWRGLIFSMPALLLASAGLHTALFLLIIFFVTKPEILLSGDPGDPDLEVSWVTLAGGGAEEMEDMLPELELEPANEPEPLKVEEEKPPPPEKKPLPKPRQNAEPAPPGPGAPEGQSSEGGGGSGVMGEGEAVWKAVRVPKPAYPDASVAAREQGRCVVRVTVLPSGDVGGAELLKSSDHPRLDASALAAARLIIFKLNGPRPAHAVTVKVPYRFSLKNV